MHEMSLVRTVVEVVLDECKGKDVGRVRSVHLTIGELHDVVEEYIPGLFRYLARDTIAADAQIVIRRVPATVICNKCGYVFPLDVRDTRTWECPSCHAYHDYHLYTGSEFTIDTIEVEGQVPAGSDTLVGAPRDDVAAIA